MLELADRYASGAYAARRRGSTPLRGTRLDFNGEVAEWSIARVC